MHLGMWKRMDTWTPHQEQAGWQASQVVLDVFDGLGLLRSL